MKDRKLLMIPGPIEFEPAVMQAMGAPTTSHIAPNFIEAFGQALERMRDVFLCPDGQPFIVAGSGTLAMDLAGANLVEPGDKALVVNTGYFGDRYGDILSRYGAEVTHVRADIGDRPTLDAVATALAADDYKLMTVTHVDTSTGVVTDVEDLAKLAGEHDVLIVVDGVCSVAGETLRMADWGVDVALTASQKAVGTPPGLALVVAGPRAMDAFRARTTPVANYYADWANWLPIMDAYEGRRVGYFGTPAVNLVAALNVSLGIILQEGMEARFERHALVSRACKAAIKALGLGQVPVTDDAAATTMTAPRFPEGITKEDLLPRVKVAGVVLAGGLHPKIKSEYFRIGHMGSVSQGDILATIGAIETGLAACGYSFERGAGVAAAMAVFAA
ncbi:MAG: alanine--glyoxylate aminotransferase family protein [Anaerolineae bacterium]|nr:alanine--glyoxylate aminotransferase family protein [Anaerolineae bacterium]